MRAVAGRGACWIAAVAACLLLAACGSAPRKGGQPAAERVGSRDAGDARTAGSRNRRSPYAPAQEDPSKRGNYTRGGLYAPGVADSAPTGGIPDVDRIPEPDVRDEPHSRYGNRSPYTVLGKTYRVLDSAEGYDETGIASYYGNKFHGRRTSNLEVYDMYAFTAAHKTLPLPSFARVTNLANGRSVIVRVNDRGPFHDGRIIDLSYAAAVKLGVDRMGTARVEVKGLMPGEDAHVGYDAVASATTTAPAPLAPVSAPTSGAGTATAATAIDRLVAALPIASADASERPPEVPASVLPAMLQAPPALGGPAPTTAIATTTVAAAAPAPASGSFTYQVATFADRGNADRALASVSGAGIAGARLEDGAAAGRAVWRLRVGPVAPADAQELAARLQGLGFGTPQRLPQ